MPDTDEIIRIIDEIGKENIKSFVKVNWYEVYLEGSFTVDQLKKIIAAMNKLKNMHLKEVLNDHKS